MTSSGGASVSPPQSSGSLGGSIKALFSSSTTIANGHIASGNFNSTSIGRGLHQAVRLAGPGLLQLVAKLKPRSAVPRQVFGVCHNCGKAQKPPHGPTELSPHR